MQTFYLNENGDIEFDARGNIRMVHDADERVQSIRLLLSTNKGEWFLNTEFGLDYSVILGKKMLNKSLIRAAVLAALEQEPRIQEVSELDIDFDHATRKLTIRFELTMDGEPVEGEVTV